MNLRRRIVSATVAAICVATPLTVPTLAPAVAEEGTSHDQTTAPSPFSINVSGSYKAGFTCTITPYEIHALYLFDAKEKWVAFRKKVMNEIRAEVTDEDDLNKLAAADKLTGTDFLDKTKAVDFTDEKYTDALQVIKDLGYDDSEAQWAFYRSDFLDGQEKEVDFSVFMDKHVLTRDEIDSRLDDRYLGKDAPVETMKKITDSAKVLDSIVSWAFDTERTAKFEGEIEAALGSVDMKVFHEIAKADAEGTLDKIATAYRLALMDCRKFMINKTFNSKEFSSDLKGNWKKFSSDKEGSKQLSSKPKKPSTFEGETYTPDAGNKAIQGLIIAVPILLVLVAIGGAVAVFTNPILLARVQDMIRARF